MSSSEAISPTAHYTSYVWFRNHLSDPALATWQGRVLFDALRPANEVSRHLGGPSLEGYLLARHRMIDELLTQAIEQDGITQVVEIAAGLSARGLRFAERYGDGITYIEADLPDMADRKRRALRDLDTLTDHHRVVALDALQADGPGSLAALARELDHDTGLAIITEGLLGYLPSDAVHALWRLIAGVLSDFPTGRYFSDLHLGDMQTPPVWAFRLLLSAFVRGRVHLHFDGPSEAEHALREAGFSQANVIRAAPEAGSEGGSALVHIIEASTN